MSSGNYNKHTGHHHRRSIRLRGYDYSRPGYYFITICIHNRNRRLFGDIVDGQMVSNESGNIAYNQFAGLPERFPNMKSDVFQIMPNHVHAVIHIVIPVGATLAVAPSRGPDDHNCGFHNYGPHAPDFEIHESVAHNDNPVARGFDQSVANHELSPRNAVNISGAMGAGVAKMAMGKTITLGDIVGAYKSLVANDCLKIYKTKNKRMGKLWQRNYYDHIIRDDASLYSIRKYIRENPLHWIDDIENHIDREIDEFDMEEVRSILCTSDSNTSSTGSSSAMR